MHLSNPLRKILTGMGICLVTSLVALFSYTAAGWGLLDACYMIVITLFGIGYGEVRPIVDPTLKLQTMMLIVVGCLSGLYSVGGFLQLVTEGEIKRALGAQKMSRGIKKMKDHTIICGYGRVGKMLAADLAEKNLPFVVIDNSAARTSEAESHGFSVLCGDAASDEVLEDARIDAAKSLASVLPQDAINVFITLTARDLNSTLEIVARAEDPKTERKLRRSGADHVILPAAIGALRIAEIISNYQPSDPAPSFLERPTAEKLPARLQVVPVGPDDELAESSLALAHEMLRDIGQVVGIQRGNSQIQSELDGDTILTPGDVLLLSMHE